MNRIEPFQYISELKDHAGAGGGLRGWVSNRRDSKGLVFIVRRDGTGFAQCVVNEEQVGADSSRRPNVWDWRALSFYGESAGRRTTDRWL